jgi:hypothetical protein
LKRARWIGSLPVARELDEIENEVRLWRAVVDQALLDYLTESQEKRDLKEKKAAKIWLRGNSRDFYDVCYLACIDPKDMMKIIFDVVDEDNLYK